ncbi:serine hydrolase family protein [Rubrivivax gelatinosus]|uniref:Beta-lactamase family protein n=1 Tax=Rubrivivax gelatinosus (strain NBRC 100245 / IL144) TaxID=983917 RepID=I0HU66_RUBGI|nr:hypothetical protein [Rubrivivax gelatinosus]BAL96553.1 hypothetical protein RGE_32140 [Rubrivivax gelatinosus IL144]
MNTTTLRIRRPLALAILVTVSGCGGGGGGGGGSSDGTPTLAQRIAAAQSVAQTSTDCQQIRPFYWEIGDGTGALVSGSFAGPLLTIEADTTLPIASASKWIYGSYVVQSQAGVLSDQDIKFLNFRSGYTNFSHCGSDTTVASCLDVEGRNGGTNGDYVAENDGYFVYSGGHMQKHASTNPALAGLDAAGLATEMRRVLGTDITMSYSGPQLAGGVETSASDYARFLRKILNGTLPYERAALGAHPVCVDPATCPQAKFTPSPDGEQWHYSIGHWVEDDPTVGDGAFSSPGAFGFYPWIDNSKTWYGVVARVSLVSDSDVSVAVDSVRCGREIRAAWLKPNTQ